MMDTTDWAIFWCFIVLWLMVIAILVWLVVKYDVLTRLVQRLKKENQQLRTYIKKRDEAGWELHGESNGRHRKTEALASEEDTVGSDQ